MDFLKNIDWSFKGIIKILIGAIIAIIAIVAIVWLFSFSVRMIFSGRTTEQFSGVSTKGYFSPIYQDNVSKKLDIILPPPEIGEVVEERAEEFEVHDYNFQYEARKKNKICDEVLSLKKREDIIFENSQENDRSCSYKFKVEKENTIEILEFLKAFGPKDITSNVYTIQRTVEGLTDQLEILQKKLDAIEKTLKDAQASYDELTDLATRKQDIESLAKLIDLKLNTIERLSKERSSISEQINSITKNRAEQLELIEYSNFFIYVSEYLFVDWKAIKDDWGREIKRLVDTFNDVIQGVSVKLLSYILRITEGLIYLFISLVLLKAVWTLVKRVWIYRKK
jgi:hypothetical protein